MVFQPCGSNAQKIPITTGLRNICRDYPAGGTVLRELLQNADDAGATEVGFVIDHRTHATDELYHSLLGPYQGPALLAYNNGVFTPKDFKSLSRPGDSQKLEDASTTGKFGRGFNSVYNWTDSPSIISDKFLLILDPHEEWSSGDSAGGPMYNFVAGHKENDVATKNHMAAYDRIVVDPSKPFDGTIIRIPLRTPEQALKSETSDRSTSVSEMTQVLQNFAAEFGECGLLFMRNIEKLELASSNMSISIEVMDRENLRLHKSSINQAVKDAVANPYHVFNCSFEATISHRSTTKTIKSSFVVHHYINGGSVNQNLRGWAQSQNLLPWVAVAAPFPASLPSSAKDIGKGTLFTILPLPIGSGQPVHIHGMFSLSPDRARLHHLGDRSSQDLDPGRWNEFLFEILVPDAWTRVLSYLATKEPRPVSFDGWPQPCEDARDPLNKALEKVFSTIARESLPLWPTEKSYVTSKEGFLYAGADDAVLREALHEVGAPVVYVPHQLQQEAEALFIGRILRPAHLSNFLRGVADKAKSWKLKTKHTIVEYLLSEPGFVDYGGIPVFPFMDGNYRSIDDGLTFIHRDDFEKKLFNRQDSHNLDIEKLSTATKLALKQGCDHSTLHPSVCYRSASSLKEHFVTSVLKDQPKEGDSIVLSGEAAAFVSKVWTWISMRSIDLLDENVSCLWLLPLSNGHHRKIKPQHPTSKVYFAPSGQYGDLMRQLDAKSAAKALPLLVTHDSGLVPASVSLLVQASDVTSTLLIEDGSNMLSFIQWLNGTFPMVEGVSDRERQLIAKSLEYGLSKSLSSADREAILAILRNLKIFQNLLWGLEKGKMKPNIAWTNLSSHQTSIGLLEGIRPVPKIENTQFLLAETYTSQQLLKSLGIECLRSAAIVQNIIIPAWSERWSNNSREQMATFILGHFSSLSHPSQRKLQQIPIVPVAKLNGEDAPKFACPGDLIDPDKSELTQLCFADEEIIPTKNLFPRFRVALRGCGLKISIDETVVQNRIRCYSSGERPLNEVRIRAHKLLKSTCNWTSLLIEQDSELSRLKWLPAVDPEGVLSLKSSDDCRSLGDQLLINSQLSVLQISISPEWRKQLGWESILPTQLLISQLKSGVEKDPNVVNAVLAYIQTNNLTEQVAADLRGIRCVLDSSGVFILPSQAFRPAKTPRDGYDGLQPYLANVDRHFWLEHDSLMAEIGVRDKLQLSDILEVQEKLEAKVPLEKSDISVAVELLTFASKFPRDSLMNLKIVDASGVFYPIHDISYDDLDLLKPKEKVNIAHPSIRKHVIKELGIDSLRERLIKGMLEIEDVDDEDEFDQRESVPTRIADNLDRYPAEMTFREYLANADDVPGTTVVRWRLDMRIHSCNSLLTPEMSDFQGAAFLVYNDGVFSDDDYKGFKNVGQGSKAQDKEKIGQFGRGSQTMYHWTDVPMILSGKYLLILDPRQEVLPKNQIKGKRKPGVKLQLSKIREACPDQLAPFSGLWDYDMTQDYYHGTIFRFPLRAARTKTILKTSGRDVDSGAVRKLMDSYFDEARVSLLFLREIKLIDFSIQGELESGWSVTRSGQANEFSQTVTCSFSKNGKTGEDKWRVCIQDLVLEADRLPKSSKRAMKNVECGLAALLSSDPVENHEVLDSLKPLQPRMFNTLPLPLASDLPIHVHATFLLSGDRQSISIDENGAHAQEAIWNRYLLQEALPKLYLALLEDVGQKVGQEVFNFWPQEQPPKRSCAELLHDSFWGLLPTSSRRVFPEAQLAATLPRGRQPNKQLFDVNQAVLDLLPKAESESLAPLLVSLGVNLVRHIPPGVARHLKAVSGVKTVDGALFRQLLKLKIAKACLLQEMTKKCVIWETLLSRAMPKQGDLEELDDCYLLPLAGTRIAKLTYIATAEDSLVAKYYVVNEKEMELFGFASEILIPSEFGLKLGPILESGKFDIAMLKLSHVKKLLKLRPAATNSSPDAHTTAWLTEFWKFWNSRIDNALEISDLDAKIFRAKRNGIEKYASPLDFFRLPAVVDPSDVSHQELCDNIPGLYRFDPNFMPKPLADGQKNFHKEESFYKFIHALEMLAGKNTLGSFVQSHLNDCHLETLRMLVISHLTSHLGHGIPEQLERVEKLGNIIKGIPLWPSFEASSTSQFISANEALIADNPNFLVPWMKTGNIFINSDFLIDARRRECLAQLKVKKVLSEVVLKNHVLPFPSNLTANDWTYLSPLINAISNFSQSPDLWKGIQPILQVSKIAADGHRQLRIPSDLYDHDDAMFLAAFRYQKASRFVDDSLRGHRWFWLKVGLRHRDDKSIKAGDYLQCLQVMHVRLSDRSPSGNEMHERDADLRQVLSPLIDSNLHTRTFSAQDWQAVSEEKIFRSKTSFVDDPEYRQSFMTSVATANRLLPLSGIVAKEHTSVCWSQIAVPAYQPAKETLAMIPGKGKPKVEIVWRHLLQMKNVAQTLRRDQLSDFLADLKSTYEYLQEHLMEAKAKFNLQSNEIWLNLDSLDARIVLMDDFRTSWHNINELFLGAADAKSMKAVRPGLAPYDKLLRGLGCESILFGTVTRPPLDTAPTLASMLRKQWENDELVDIAYMTGGRPISAHRVVLAAVSKKCAGQFSPQWPREDVINFDENTDPDDYLSYHTLDTMIRFAYEAPIAWETMVIMKYDNAEKIEAKLNLLLDLHKGADCWDMPVLMSQVEDKLLENAKAFLNLDNIVNIYDRAGKARALLFQAFCADFMKRNKEMVEKVHGKMQ